MFTQRSTTKQRPYRLHSIPFSHYNDKALWALQRYNIDYQVKAYLPLFHMPAIAALTKGKAKSDKVSTKLSTPVLELADGSLCCDSSLICKKLSDEFGHAQHDLYPEGALELESRFHDKLGPHTRRVAYYFLLQDKKLIQDIARGNVGKIQAHFWIKGQAVIGKFLKSALSIDEAKASKSRGYIESEFEFVADLLKDGRPYLIGERFSAADLTFAAMSAPALLVQKSEGFGAHMPDIKLLSPEARDMVETFRKHPAGEFALRMYREERQGLH